ncbi:MAG: SOS response-associated peptidase family protein, partial [Deltaproteobacteria bacterium]|nr:SOS response-associated peptidase family protein [Deltaproteobacteria bacterium]
YLFRRTDGKLFVMAGLWQDGHYVVLTRASQGVVSEIHHRMPVLLAGSAARQWLAQGELGEPPQLTRTAVSPRINRTDNDDPACLDPVPQTAFNFD